ncbi:protein shisa-2 homolog [Rhineura floridana]|uniref:protein shisa-2 homolog n=1 Tax=Rhineura floridana TaxID=261503 RepID=UPI002AC82D05|nr:protein shisa-2 homolog [Rhineura floridana]
MARAVLCLRVLLLALGGASAAAEGEPCCSWMCGAESPPAACPKRRDGADAPFCCGTCSLPYCCSSREDRLDQQRCPRGGPVKKTTQSSADEERDWNLILFFITAAGFALIAIGVYFFYTQIQTCLRSCTEQGQQTQQEDVGSPSRLSVINPSHLSGDRVSTASPNSGAEDLQGTCDLPLALDSTSVQQFHYANPGILEGEAIILSPEAPLNQGGLGLPSEPVLQMEM